MQDTAARRSRPGWRSFAGLLLLGSLLWSGVVQGGPQVPQPIRLDTARNDIPVQSGLAWFGAQPLGGISAASNGRLPFKPFDAEEAIRFEEGKSLWLKLRLQAAAANPGEWELEVPVPVIDAVLLYQQDASGRWFARAAGDHVAQREWPQAGRYPFFRLQLRPGAVTDLYVEIRHSTPLVVPLRIVASATHRERTQVEYMGLGLLMGALGLLVCASLLRAALLRDTTYGWYALFALLAVLALAAFTGVAAHLLWGNAGAWVDVAPGLFAMLGGSLSMLVVARLSAVLTRIRWLAAMLHLTCAAGPFFAVLYVLVDRSVGAVLLGAYLAVVGFLVVHASTGPWRRGDPVGLWMLAGAVPLALSVSLAVGRVTGLLQHWWLTEYALVLALTFHLPMLFGALNSRSGERRSVELRRLAAASQDPLTGLMKRGPFLARLRQATARHSRRGEGAAVAVIELANYEWIQKTRGAEAVEEALLRGVIKLRRLVRDVDTTGRLAENRFGLIIEGLSSRRPMSVVASRLVAAGLMEEPDRPKDVVLHFHVAAVLLDEYPGSAEDLLHALAAALDDMSPRTQRPVRFLEPGAGVPSEPGAGSSAPEGMAPA